MRILAFAEILETVELNRVAEFKTCRLLTFMELNLKALKELIVLNNSFLAWIQYWIRSYIESLYLRLITKLTGIFDISRISILEISVKLYLIIKAILNIQLSINLILGVLRQISLI